MINVIDVIYALKKEFKTCIPKSHHYFGHITETYKNPAFLYLLVFDNDVRSSYFRKDVTLDLQIIYFGTKDECGVPDFEEKMQTMDKLKTFLSTFNLWVGDRNLKFEYNFSESDKQLTINIKFKFKDEIINIEFEKDQAMEMVDKILINKEEVIWWVYQTF